MKKLFIVLGIVVVLALVVFLSPDNKNSGGKKVHTQSMQSRTIETLTLGSGFIDYDDVRKLSSEVTAKVKKISIKEGDLIEKGQLLIELEEKELQDRVNQLLVSVALRETDQQRSQIQLNTLKRKLDDQQVLLKQKLASKSSIDSINDQIDLAEIDLKTRKLNLKNAQSDLTSSKKDLEKAKIYAPITGLVSYLNVSEGELVVANNVASAFVSIADPSQIIAWVDVDETSIGNIKINQPVRLFPAGDSDVTIDAKVVEIAITAREVQGRLGRVFRVKVLLDTQITNIIKPGMSARVEIITSLVEDINSVNIISIVDEDDKKFVWVVQDNTALKKEITLGESDDQYIEVVSGIELDDQIISGPSRTIANLKADDSVVVENVDLESETNSDESADELN